MLSKRVRGLDTIHTSDKQAAPSTGPRCGAPCRKRHYCATRMIPGPNDDKVSESSRIDEI